METSLNERLKTKQRDGKNIISLDLGTIHFKEGNELVREAFSIADVVEIDKALAQRYLGCAMPKNKRLEIYGVPGNDMAAYMDGGEIEVFGNAQDQIGNTMNAGSVIIHGRCGDAAGYSMRGGEIFIRDDCGWRVGIHMKQYENKCPVIVIGGNAGEFLGEYMAGGIIVLLGEAGKFLGSGMHGGVIYLRNALKDEDVPDGLIQEEITEDDASNLQKLLKKYNDCFKDDLMSSIDEDPYAFHKLVPESARPYASVYVN